jgi:hypothetical protein
VIHHLSDDQRQCSSCGGVANRPLGSGKQTYLRLSITYQSGMADDQRWFEV